MLWSSLTTSFIQICKAADSALCFIHTFLIVTVYLYMCMLKSCKYTAYLRNKLKSQKKKLSNFLSFRSIVFLFRKIIIFLFSIWSHTTPTLLSLASSSVSNVEDQRLAGATFAKWNEIICEIQRGGRAIKVLRFKECREVLKI